MDILWMGCLSASTVMSVPEPPLIITRAVVDFHEPFEMEAPDEHHLHHEKRGISLHQLTEKKETV